MLLAIDSGNTNIVFAIFDDDDKTDRNNIGFCQAFKRLVSVCFSFIISI